MMTMAVVAWSQTSIEGVVRDKATGEMISGAHVFLDDSYKSTFTDGKGRFSFSKVVPGDYEIMVTHIAYEKYSVSVTHSAGKSGLEIELVPAVHLSDEFIITAVRSDERTPGAVSTITKQELRQINLGQDMPFLLATSPSVVSTSDAGTGIGYTGMRIRGVDQNRINVTINGIPLNDPESHAVFWVDLPDFASSVEDIQIQRGVGTSTNGAGAFGGSVNIQTEKLNKDPYASAGFVAGSFNTLKSKIGFGSGLIDNRFAFDGRVSRIVSDGFIDRASADLFSYYFSGGYYGKNTVLKAIVTSGKEVTYQAWGGIPSEILDTNRTWNPQGLYTDAEGKLQTYNNQVDDYLQNHYHLHLLQRLNNNWNVNIALHLTTGVGYYESYKESRKFSAYGLPNAVYGNDTIKRTDLIQRKWLDNRFYGLTWSAIRTGAFSHLTVGGAANVYDGDHFGTLVWLKYPGSAAKDHEWYRGNGLKKDGNVFAKYHHHFNGRWMLFGDVQLRAIDYTITGIDDDLRDIGQHHEYLFFNPKAGASFSHNDIHESWLALGIANREPNRSNFTDARPDGPVPEPERLFNIETGHKMRYRRFSSTLNLYLMYYKDQLVLTGEINDVGAPVMTNVDKSYRAGIEVVAGVKVTRWFDWEANATLSRNRIIDFTAFVDDWDTWGQRDEALGETDISFSPSIIANNFLRFYPVKNATVAFVSQYVGRQYLDNTSSADRMLDAWFVNNIHFRYTLALPGVKEFSLNLMLNNIFDVEYESNGWIYRYYEDGVHRTMDGLFPQAGFNVLGGISVLF